MKKTIRPPPLPRQTGNNNRDRTFDGLSITASALGCDFKKSIMPRSIDLLIALQYRRYLREMSWDVTRQRPDARPISNRLRQARPAES
jgi:hypothetical protein